MYKKIFIILVINQDADRVSYLLFLLPWNLELWKINYICWRDIYFWYIKFIKNILS